MNASIQTLRTAYDLAAAKLDAKVNALHAAEAAGDWDSVEKIRKAVTRLDCAARKAYVAWDDAHRPTRNAWTH